MGLEPAIFPAAISVLLYEEKAVQLLMGKNPPQFPQARAQGWWTDPHFAFLRAPTFLVKTAREMSVATVTQLSQTPHVLHVLVHVHVVHAPWDSDLSTTYI